MCPQLHMGVPHTSTCEMALADNALYSVAYSGLLWCCLSMPGVSYMCPWLCPRTGVHGMIVHMLMRVANRVSGC